MIKKNRYKPLYKKFVNLRKNVQNRRKLRILNFKKEKWKKLITYINRLRYRRKKRFKVYDMNRIFVTRFHNSFKRKFKTNLQTKQRLKLFYGGLLKSYIKNRVKLAHTQKRHVLNSFKNFNSFFISLLEKRLDILLYRSHFVLSVRAARQLISHGHIKINKIIIHNSSFQIKKGDVISVKSSSFKLIEFNINISNKWPIPPKYLQINYKTLQILLKDDVQTQNFSISFPFFLDLYTILRYLLKNLQ